MTGIDANGWIATHVLGHEPALRRYLGRFLSSAADVADVIQDTYARLLALGALERNRIDSPEAYLFTTARHLALDRLRRQPVISFEALTELERCSVLGYGPDPHAEVNAQQELALLERAIASLPERCRQVLSLRAIDGMAQKEIAKRLGMAEHTVEKHLAHGVRLCAAKMLGSLGTEPLESRESTSSRRRARKAERD